MKLDGNSPADALQESVTAVAAKLRGYLDDGKEAFVKRNELRAKEGLCTVGVVGYGRHGKDTVAELLAKNTKLKYGGSTSRIASPLIAEALGLSVDEAFARRHEDRMFWFRWCNELRRQEGPCILLTLLLANSDIAVGMRGIEEINQYAGYTVNYWIWVENPRKEKDPTVDFTYQDTRKYGAIKILNDGSLDDLNNKVINYAKFTDLLKG